MWTRPDLKAKAKIAYKKNYWKCVLVGFIACLLEGTISLNYSFNEGVKDGVSNGSLSLGDTISNAASNTGISALLLAAVTSVFVLIAIAIGIALSVFILNPILMGCKGFFLNNRRHAETDAGEIFAPFRANYINIVKGMFMMDLYIFLWSLLLIVPGIIKSYEYKLVPYILYENPDMNWRDALKLSSQLMNGNKGPAFVLDLSFIGWMILSGITFNILGLFMVFPYIAATDAELYIAIAHPEESNIIAPAAPEAKTVEFEVTENK